MIKDARENVSRENIVLIFFKVGFFVKESAEAINELIQTEIDLFNNSVNLDSSITFREHEYVKVEELIK